MQNYGNYYKKYNVPKRAYPGANKKIKWVLGILKIIYRENCSSGL